MSSDAIVKQAPQSATSTDSDVVIETRNLTKVYRDFWVDRRYGH